MASCWLFLPLVLSGFLIVADFKSLQDGTSTKNVESPANTSDWKWKAAADGTTTQGESPLAKDINLLMGKCLLAILLLALVAAIFIVCSGVLAIMLWRQKRAYRLGQANHTEMVCISSLLSAEKEEEEEEERRRRHPKVKRVQLLGDTASETEADNLTLNSFLPEH
ncbi:P-selectin glycoprotein ligand 1 [Crotalus adamanteus]|uniref:P-selectin glycoprotein ligand 1 n=1 Tax=Crotalus adamanteus TaxID=8729 RepID=A0AAW1AR50_CROAD